MRKLTVNNAKTLVEFFLFVNIIFAGIVILPLVAVMGKDALPVAFITVGILNIVVVIILFIYALYLKKKNSKAAKVFAEKGICDEYIAEYTKAYGDKMSYFQKLVVADCYASLGRFDSCEYILERLPGELAMHGRDKLLFYKEYILVYLNTGRYRLAADLFNTCRGDLDKYFGNSSPPLACSYYDDAALIMAVMGDFRGADGYRAYAQAAGMKDLSAAYVQYMIMGELYYIDGNTAEAQRSIEAARTAVISYDKYKYPWMKDHYLQVINKGAQLAMRIYTDLHSTQV